MIDIDQLGMQQRFAEGIDMSENGQAMDAIREVGPGKPLSRLRSYPGQFRERVLPLADRRQQFLRAVGWKAASPPNNVPTRWRAQWLEAMWRRSLDPAIDEALQASCASARNRCPTRSPFRPAVAAISAVGDCRRRAERVAAWHAHSSRIRALARLSRGNPAG
jgi:trimethylamine--corrinoid protein Co-methyltransferase